MMRGLTYGSVCSGVEAASVAWEPLGMRPLWFAEFDKFPSQVLAHHWPNVPNLGDMTSIEEQIDEVGVPDILIGGTPCQAFSTAGLRGGLSDERGNLALSFVRLYHAIRDRKPNAIALWENVPGVLSSKDNSFGHFLGGLVGADSALSPVGGWQRSGVAVGPTGAACWRVLDAQHFGVAQQRRRVFVVAGSSVERCTEILFERISSGGYLPPRKKNGPAFYHGGDAFVSRCLMASCITSPMTNTVIVDGGRLRQLTPVEYERLQGFPDGHTAVLSDTQRYKAMGNSMAVPVIAWIGERIVRVMAAEDAR